jgi:hypothetical protein
MGTTKVENLRRIFTPGTRVLLVHMEDAQSVPEGTKGTVEHVDDYGNVHMLWDNGRTLSLIPEVDKYKIIKDE